MGLIISINGTDFEPYSSVHAPTPLVGRAKASQKVQPIKRELDHPEEFDDILATASPNKFKAYEDVQNQKEEISRKIVYAKDLMTSPVITLTKEELASLAQEVLKKNHIRHIPIVDSDKKIIGIISDRSLMLASGSTRLSEIMSKKVIAAQSTSHLQEIVKVMVDHKINSIPIVDDGRCVIGIVTSSDVMKSVFKNPNVDLWG